MEMMLLEELASCPRRIPNAFWNKVGDEGVFELDRCPKEEVLKKKEEIIERILEEINSMLALPKLEELYRLFHALTILGVKKDDKRVTKPDEDMVVYSVVYYIWRTDSKKMEYTEFKDKEKALGAVTEIVKIFLDKLGEMSSK